MNNKGFTMIELLMVIVIIGILSTIMIPNIMAIINKNKENNSKILESNIISAAKVYVNDNKYDLSFSCSNGVSKSEQTITIKTLVDNGYIKNNVINPNTKEKYDLNNSTVKVTLNCQSKGFSYTVDLK